MKVRSNNPLVIASVTKTAGDLLQNKWFWYTVAGFAVFVVIRRSLKTPAQTDLARSQGSVKEALAAAASNANRSMVWDKTGSSYKLAADEAYRAMNRIGTNEKALFDALRRFNAEELKVVAKEFGTRPKTLFEGWMFPSIIGSLDMTQTGRSMTIFEWFNTELSGDLLRRMKDMWRPTGLWG